MVETDLRRFESGQRARARENDDDGQMLVLGAHGKTAEECYVSAIDQTVAEANPEYPADDPVVDVVFVEGIEDALGLDWSADDVLQLAADENLDRARIKVYGYPESRLEPRSTDTDDRSFRSRGKEKPRQSPRQIDRLNGGEESDQ